ncbi:MAG: 30S ribosomal protein S12 methylthiotransferase RimO [Spirochaetaceae bacterium]|jgi:ribosomal protein S12 methylthiotransferase|nr:30S ribosomal protein S12 methylthiotransferase RimO [Spirochaetaceae bacterium]
MKYYVESLGCVKNQVDAETMIASLDGAGAEFAENPDDADLVIVNSCGFIEDAKKESINAVINFRNAYPDKKIIMSGCLAQRYQTELRRILGEADAVFGNEDPGGIVSLAFGLTGASPPSKAAPPSAATERLKLLSPPGSAYVKIAEGCDNRCSFCAIPLIRGSLRSRSIDDIVNECATLYGRGVRELCLVAQDLASYGADLDGGGAGRSGKLPELLKALSALQGDFWVRLLYLHPDHFPFGILETMAADRRFLPYFDIPFQHASRKILRAMNRRGDAETYLALTERIRAALPDSVIRSTFLTGFPGETDGDFKILLDFQRAARLDWLGVFIFSREEGVPAYSLRGRPSRKTSRERKRVLEARQTPITCARMDRFIGQSLTALVEGPVAGENGLYLARLFCHAPEIDGAAVIESSANLPAGSFVRCKVTGRSGFDLLLQPAG